MKILSKLQIETEFKSVALKILISGNALERQYLFDDFLRLKNHLSDTALKQCKEKIDRTIEIMINNHDVISSGKDASNAGAPKEVQVSPSSCTPPQVT